MVAPRRRSFLHYFILEAVATLWSIVLFSRASAQVLPFQTYTTKDGLSGESISILHQDRRGFIWIASSEGLMLYDGMRFNTFSSPSGLPYATAGVMFVLLAVCSTYSQNASIKWDVFSFGASRASGQANMLLMNVGQNFVTGSSGSNIVLKSGFMVHPLLTGPVVSVPEDETLPITFNLDQNYPNPFNPSTHIRFALPQKSHVRLTIYNILGQEIVVMVDEEKPAGRHTLEWHGTNAGGGRVASGVYFYRMQAKPAGGNTFVSLKKMLILK